MQAAEVRRAVTAAMATASELLCLPVRPHVSAAERRQAAVVGAVRAAPFPFALLGFLATPPHGQLASAGGVRGDL